MILLYCFLFVLLSRSNYLLSSSLWIECARLKLEGACCPTPDLSMLGCCNSSLFQTSIDSEWLGYIYVDHAGR